MAEGGGVCEVCRKPAKQFCSSCRSVFYCSRDCQKQDWKTHKTRCKPYVIQNHPVFGRHMVATRDIRAGEVILREAPVVVGPKQRSPPLCLGCHRPPDGSYCCPSCHYPLCGPPCRASPVHKRECAVLSQAKTRLTVDRFDIPHPAYECITPLRCLLLREADPRQWEVVSQLQDHSEAVKASELHGLIQRNTVDFLRGFMRYEGASEAEIYRMCGVVVVNSFEVRHHGSRVRALYPQAAMLAHQCVPNTKHAFDANLTMILRATMVIRKGTPITATYTNTFWNTMQRRKQLKLTKCFLCTCQRCADPSELGTHFGTLLCGECGTGFVQPIKPLDLHSDWTCSKCGVVVMAKTVFWGDQILHKELKGLDQTSAGPFEEFLDHYKKALHPGHRFLIEAKYALVKIYGNSPEHRYKDLSREQLENKVKYCRELLQVVEVLAPGQSLLRGTLLLELQAALVALARLLLSNDVITQDDSRDYMTEAVKHLKEASEILRHEPEMDEGGLDQKLKKLSEELDV
uniref:MYND-type domain-containing protein n=1 Tax=Scylla olivacea TaxID=85551 RepID=A0A0P4VWD8_SCYOL